MKTTAASSLLLLSALAGVSAAADEQPIKCTVHDCNNSYDLSPLSSEKDYVVSSHTGRNITFNVCKSVTSELWNPSVEDQTRIGAFFRGDHGDISIGDSNATLHVRDGNPVLLMTDGSACPQSENLRASTAIRFICDKRVEEGQPQLIAQLPPENENACAYFIEWRTKHACPVPNRYAYWKTAIMVIVIVLALVLTGLALVSLHKLIKRRRSSSDVSLPVDDSFGPWYAVVTPSALAERARDLGRHLTGQDPWGHPNGSAHGNGSASASAGAGAGAGTGRNGWGFNWRSKFGGRGRFGRYDRRNFSRLPQSAEEEAMMGGNGGPFSLDDDDDDDSHEGNTNQANGRAALNGGGESFAEESAAWGASRPRGMDNAGVIRL